MKTRSKLANVFWLIYLAVLVSFIVWDISSPSDNTTLLDNIASLFVSILFLSGLIGFIFQRRIGYRLLWRILFGLIALSFGFTLITLAFIPYLNMPSNNESLNVVELTALVAVAIPSYYALFSYAYRSPHIWKKT